MAVQVGIDLGSRAIKIVSGRMKGPVFEIQRAIQVPVDLDGDTESAVLEAIAAVGPSFGKPVPGGRFSVSGRELIIRYTKVPPVPLWRLELLMDFEVQEMAEQAGEGLASDYNLVHLPDASADDETVLVAVVKAAFLEARHRAITETLGEPHSAQPASIALFNAYLHAGELHEDQDVLLVDMGERNTEIVLQRDGELLFARNLAIGGRNFTEAVASAMGLDLERAEALKERLGNVTPKGQAQYASGQEERVANALIGPAGQFSSMLQSTLAFAKAQTGRGAGELGQILVSGGGAAMRGLPEYLQSVFPCPVARFQPSSAIDLSALDEEEAASFELDPGRFSVALGLAVAGEKADAFLVDLVPEPVKKKREFSRRTVWTIAAGVIAVLSLCVHAYLESSSASDLDARASALRRKARVAKRERAELQDHLAAIRQANVQVEALEDLPRPAYALAVVQELVQRHRPDGVWVRSITMGRETRSRPGRRTPGEARLLVRVGGLVLDVSQRASEALNEMKTRMTEDRKAIAVRISKQQDVQRPGVRQTEFELEIDPFPRPDLDAAEGEGEES